MQKREADFGTLFRHWMVAHPHFTAPYELKQTQEDYISFSCVPEHQRDCLFACTTDKGFLYKISDQSQGYKPFDFIFYRNSPAYVVIKYPKCFEIISIQNFLNEVKISRRKSLTSARAREISVKTVVLKKPH